MNLFLHAAFERSCRGRVGEEPLWAESQRVWADAEKKLNGTEPNQSDRTGVATCCF